MVTILIILLTYTENLELVIAVGGVTRRQFNRGIVGQVSAAAIDFPLLQNIQTGAGVHPVFSSMDAWGAFLRVKRLGRENDH